MNDERPQGGGEHPGADLEPGRRFPTSFRGYAPAAVDEHLDSLNRRIDELEGQGQYLATLNESLASELTAVSEDRDRFRAEVASLREELDAIRAELPAVEELRASLEEMRASYEARIQALSDLIVAGVRELDERRRELAEASRAPRSAPGPQPATRGAAPSPEPEPEPEELEEREAVPDVRGAWAPPEE